MTSRPIPRPRRAPGPVRPNAAALRPLAGLLTAAAFAAVAPSAPAQYYGGGYGGGDSCGCSSAAAPSYSYAPTYSAASYNTAAVSYGSSYSTVSDCRPVYTASAPPVYQTAAVECVPVQQVQTVAVCEPPKMVAVPQTVTDRVPVTKYVSVAQTVKRPQTVTRYEEREFTEMMPQTETRTAMTQQVNYRPVSSTRQVIKDAGYWQTRRVANCPVSPCQYDPRPGFRGSMNRFGYNVRNLFRPAFTTQRQYVPRQMACNVTTTSQVAEVTNVPKTYQVTTMVPVVKKRKVAVQEVVWEDQQVTALKPMTEYKEVSRTVYNYLPSTDSRAVAYLSGRGTATALRPESDGAFDRVPSRTADASDEKYERTAEEDDEFGDGKQTSLRGPGRGSRRVGRPVDPAPKVRKLTDADRKRLAALRLAARSRGANDERMAARPATTAAPAAVKTPAPSTKDSAAPTLAGAATLPGAAGRVPRVDAALRWDAGPTLPLVALTDAR